MERPLYFEIVATIVLYTGQGAKHRAILIRDMGNVRFANV